MKHCGGELSSAPNPHVGDNLICIPDDDEACCSFSLLNNQSYSLPTLSPSLYPLTLSPARPTVLCCAVLCCDPSPAQPSPAQPSPAQPSPAQPSPAQLMTEYSVRLAARNAVGWSDWSPPLVVGTLTATSPPKRCPLKTGPYPPCKCDPHDACWHVAY